MSSKTKNIVGWVLGGLVTALFLFSGAGKFMAGEEGAKMAEGMGLTLSTLKTLGVVEIIAAFLFLYPRTGILGTLLLAAYMGGVIATHLEHGMDITAPCVIQAIIWCTAVFRFPELRSRIMSNS